MASSVLKPLALAFALIAGASVQTLSAYVFTNPDVTRALIAAKQRGVDVAVVADHRSNLQEQSCSRGPTAVA